jgi:hypothetical protein
VEAEAEDATVNARSAPHLAAAGASLGALAAASEAEAAEAAEDREAAAAQSSTIALSPLAVSAEASTAAAAAAAAEAQEAEQEAEARAEEARALARAEEARAALEAALAAKEEAIARLAELAAAEEAAASAAAASASARPLELLVALIDDTKPAAGLIALADTFSKPLPSTASSSAAAAASGARPHLTLLWLGGDQEQASVYMDSSSSAEDVRDEHLRPALLRSRFYRAGGGAGGGAGASAITVRHHAVQRGLDAFADAVSEAQHAAAGAAAADFLIMPPSFLRLRAKPERGLVAGALAAAASGFMQLLRGGVGAAGSGDGAPSAAASAEDWVGEDVALASASSSRAGSAAGASEQGAAARREADLLPQLRALIAEPMPCGVAVLFAFDDGAGPGLGLDRRAVLCPVVVDSGAGGSADGGAGPAAGSRQSLADPALAFLRRTSPESIELHLLLVGAAAPPHAPVAAAEATAEALPPPPAAAALSTARSAAPSTAGSVPPSPAVFAAAGAPSGDPAPLVLGAVLAHPHPQQQPRARLRAASSETGRLSQRRASIGSRSSREGAAAAAAGVGGDSGGGGGGGDNNDGLDEAEVSAAEAEAAAATAAAASRGQQLQAQQAAQAAHAQALLDMIPPLVRQRRGLVLGVSHRATVTEALEAMLRGHRDAFGLVVLGLAPDIAAASARLGEGAAGEAVLAEAQESAVRSVAALLTVCERFGVSCVVVAGMGVATDSD